MRNIYPLREPKRLRHTAKRPLCCVPTLLENSPWAPVGRGLRHQISNRYPETETKGVGLGHCVFQPSVLHYLWYRLESPTSTTEAATLTQAGTPFVTDFPFQPVPKSFTHFPIIQFFLFVFTVVQYPSSTVLFVHWSCSSSKNIRN